MEELRKILEEMGLSSYKVETYLSLLKLKSSSGTIQQIAKNSQVPSCKLYENLRWLYENGYITLVSEKPLSYRANDPKSILNSEIEKRSEKLDELGKEVKSIKFNFPVVEKDIVQITSTKEAYFKKIKELVRNSKKSIYYTAKHWNVDAELIRLLHEKIKHEVKVRAIGPRPSKPRENKNISWLKEIGVKIKYADIKETHFAIYDNSFVLISLRKESEKNDYHAIWIKSGILAELLSNHFEELWKK
jgi:sugar-specific transcriptional regulator TrmB